VYGFLGLTQFNIKPDYAKSVKEVFLEAAVQYIALYGLTLSLSLTHIGHGIELGLPSWVPDWSTYRGRLGVHDTFSENDALYRGSSSFGYDVSTPDVLVVYGMKLCEVSEVEPDPSTNTREFMRRIWRWYLECLVKYNERPYRNRIPLLQAILLLVLDEEDPLNGNAAIKVPSDAFFRLGAGFVGLLCVLEGNTEIGLEEGCQQILPKLGLDSEDFARTFSKQFLGDTAVLGPWKTFNEALDENIAGWYKISNQIKGNLTKNRFFHTKDGYFGIGTDIAQANDIVCALKGCKLPVILRQVESNFVLVGTCLIQGLKGGELGRILDENDGEIQEFTIH
jgi:hypothetical protein